MVWPSLPSFLSTYPCSEREREREVKVVGTVDLTAGFSGVGERVFWHGDDMVRWWLVDVDFDGAMLNSYCNDGLTPKVVTSQ